MGAGEVEVEILQRDAQVEIPFLLLLGLVRIPDPLSQTDHADAAIGALALQLQLEIGGALRIGLLQIDRARELVFGRVQPPEPEDDLPLGELRPVRAPQLDPEPVVGPGAADIVVHNHARHGVFHSSTDDRTIDRLLPMLAERLFKPAQGCGEPQILSPCAAELPMADGQVLRASLRGPLAGAVEADARWESVHAEFARGEQRGARHLGDRLRLVGGGVVLELGIPSGASVQISAEQAAVRQAVVHSLVVNAKRELFAESLLVLDVKGSYFTKKTPCEVRVVERGESPASDVNRNFIEYRDVEGFDLFGNRRRGALTCVWEDKGLNHASN